MHRSGTAGGHRAGEAVFAAGVPWWLGGSLIPDNNNSIRLLMIFMVENDDE